ncbi:MAG: hypothetical protein PF518_15755 [Spirochaetaceae bacterium]|jgi:hypothetical protein|nr:hypothetical protein [Spirochaetaceae bacterium]
MKKSYSKVMIIVTGTLLISLVSSCASFKGDIPLTGKTNDIVYISPENHDGIQDSFVLPVLIPDTKGLKIAGYNISVLSETGEKVFTIGDGKVIREGKKSIPGKKTPLRFPDEIVWEGLNDDGSWVKDGLYTMEISAWDYAGNRRE